MKNDKHSDTITRDGILKLLSDAEVAKVSTAETALALAVGDEYVDLVHLDEGVRRATKAPLKLDNVVSRKAVHQDTWAKIVAVLAPRPAPPLA